MEYISGPVHGFYLACYTLRAREGHYGYAKICQACPVCVWDMGIALRKVAAGPFKTETQALVAVQAEARRKLAQRAAHRARVIGQPDRDRPIVA